MGLIPEVAPVVLHDVAAQGEPEAQTLTAILRRPHAPDRGKEHGAAGFRDGFAGVVWVADPITGRTDLSGYLLFIKA